MKKAILWLVSLTILLLVTATFFQGGANPIAKGDSNDQFPKLDSVSSGVDIPVNVLSTSLTSTLNRDQSLQKAPNQAFGQFSGTMQCILAEVNTLERRHLL